MTWRYSRCGRIEIRGGCLAEQAVETYPQNLLEFIQIHDADALASPDVVGEVG